MCYILFFCEELSTVVRIALMGDVYQKVFSRVKANVYFCIWKRDDGHEPHKTDQWEIRNVNRGFKIADNEGQWNRIIVCSEATVE